MVLPYVQRGNTFMRSLTLKLPKHLDDLLDRLARQRGITRSAVLRDALQAYAGNGATIRGSALEAAGDLVGCVTGGPTDLSTNKKYLNDLGR